MKIIKLAFLLGLVLISCAFAQEELLSPGITPDSFFYGFDRALEALQKALTFSPEAKAKLALQLASERLAEAKEMEKKGKIELASKTADDYGKEIEEGRKYGLVVAEEVKKKEIDEAFDKVTSTHLSILKEVLPDEALYKAKRKAEETSIETAPTLEEKARRQLSAVGNRSEEARKMAEKGKVDLAKKAAEEYGEELEKAITYGKEIAELAKKREFDALIARATSIHIDVLEEVLEKVPERAKPYVEHAMNSSLKRCLEALRRMRKDVPERTAELMSKFAEEELNKFMEKIEKGKFERAEKRLKIYEEFLNETEEATERLEGLGRNVTALAEHVCNMTYKHIEVLERILEKVPERAKPAIEKAINSSLKRQATCMERILKAINTSVEKGKWKACTSDEDCEELLYCPEEFGFEVKCHIPPRKSEGICHCWPRWKKLRLNCTTDADCRHFVCPMVIGIDTPICREGICACGPRWELVNRTEWKERFKKEFTAEVKESMGMIKQKYEERMKERIEEMFHPQILRPEEVVRSWFEGQIAGDWGKVFSLTVDENAKQPSKECQEAFEKFL